MAAPCTAAMVGMGSSYSVRKSRAMRFASARCSASVLPFIACKADKSRPEQKASPAPRRTSTRQPALAASSNAAVNSNCIWGVIALRRSGRFRVIVRTALLSEIRIVEASMRFSLTICALLRSGAESARQLRAGINQRLE